MDKSWLMALLPLLMLSINVFSQLLTVHLTRRVVFSIVSGFIIGLMALVVSFFFALASIENVYMTLLSYLALSFGYWAFLNLNITSLRIRVLRELLTVEQTGLTTTALFERYSSHELLNRRLERLKRWNQVMRINGQWMLQSNKLLFLLSILIFLRQVIFGKKKARALLSSSITNQTNL